MDLKTIIKQRDPKYLLHDIFVGMIIALVSIPISIGYAQIAGLPAIYGLYGSFLPILVYAFITSSPRFIVGVDAMPAAMLAAYLSGLSIRPESKESVEIASIMSFLVALWFIIFYFLKAGRIVRFISAPVMGGFISGVGSTIIIMQIPKLFGGNPASGELPALLLNIYNELPEFNLSSALLGFGTIAIILICKKIIPNIPVPAIMLAIGALLQLIFHFDRQGVKLLPTVESGLPRINFPSITLLLRYDIGELLIESLSISVVIMAQALLATGSLASRHGDKIDNNRELLAYGAMNFASSLVGCCPINGSVSRSGIANTFKGGSQLMCISASITMGFVLIFGTSVLKYMPVPMLSAIVITALMGIVDFGMLKKLWKHSRNEAFVFIASFLAVLMLGTVNGVIVGCLLSFGEVAVQGVVPPTTFMGRIPGHGNFHTLGRNKHALPIKNTIIYRFSGNLFFANIDKFEEDILNAIGPEIHQVVVDARGIGNIDITAIDRLLLFSEELERKGIRFYITEHDSSLNDKIRKLGGEELIKKGVVRRTITLALKDAGLLKPYDLIKPDNYDSIIEIPPDESSTEYEWAYGSSPLTNKEGTKKD
ncbi:MAG: SulP family inorganic anion transporter [Lachnospiraceae bacterium]|nr:SulP family inorganic anion transporter [Lachnospiraceae bacterium]